MRESPVTPLIGHSAAMRSLRDLIERLAPARATVLITGESGTGKELVADALHTMGPRAAGPFVPINCGAIPKDLIESELFGYRKGAFTGASSHRVGRFEMADGGTLFLDEVGDLPLEMQVKLLRVLQDRHIVPLGSAQAVPVDVRIIAATHRDLELAVQEGRFREDLFYRLNVIPLRTTALRDRPEDVDDLLQFYARRHAPLGHAPVGFAPCLIAALRSYDWPGNVRELSNLVDRFSALFPGQTLRRDGIPDWALPTGFDARVVKSAAPAALQEVREVADDQRVRAPWPPMVHELAPEPSVLVMRDQSDGQELFHRPGEAPLLNPAEQAVRMAHGLEPLDELGISLRDRMNHIERSYIEQALLSANWNVSRTARILRLQRTTLIEKLNKHGIKKTA